MGPDIRQFGEWEVRLAPPARDAGGSGGAAASLTVVPVAAEKVRLDEDASRAKNWKRWGPYLSERQWGTVREDYSAGGDCWDYFPHDHARSRAYRWGEDGLLGICDRECRLCFALALWNGKDPILKERLFGLTGPEGNHGEDVKEYYFYLDSTPTHSYMKALYKYPQAEYPYARLVEENRRRGKGEPEFELVDTGVFDENRYFDVFAEYAKASPERHPDPHHRGQSRPRGGDAAPAAPALVPQHLVLGAHERRLRDEAEYLLRRRRHSSSRSTRRSVVSVSPPRPWPDGTAPRLLFTENETNASTPLRRRRTRTRTSRTRSTSTSSTAGPTRSTRPAAAPRRPSTTSSRFRPAARPSVRLRLFAEDEAPKQPFGHDFDGSSSSGCARPTSSTTARIPAA